MCFFISVSFCISAAKAVEDFFHREPIGSELLLLHSDLGSPEILCFKNLWQLLSNMLFLIVHIVAVVVVVVAAITPAVVVIVVSPIV